MVGGFRDGANFVQRRGRVGAWLAVPKRGKSREGLACLAVPQEGAKARGGIQGLRFRKGRVGVLFFESWRVDLVTCSRRGLPRAVWCRSHCRSDCEGRTKHGLLSGDLSCEATYGQQCSQFHVMP